MLNFFIHFILQMSTPGYYLEVKEYPVFKPNEFFWKNHWSENSGEEQWQAYARVMRDILANSLNLKKTDLTAEDKYEYKKMLKK